MAITRHKDFTGSFVRHRRPLGPGHQESSGTTISDATMTELFKVTYGSHLYGTSTPTSDLDEKVVYLPELDDVLLGKKLRTYKTRVDSDGNPVSDTAQMPDGGVEVEYVPFQTFCRDFLNGQTYALECAFAVMREVDCPEWVYELEAQFLTRNVSSMAGFAKKQTADYVHRGVRLEKARRLLEQLEHTAQALESMGFTWPRLDTEVEGKKVLHAVAAAADVELGSTVNNGRTMETLRLNGRDYLETTTLEHLRTAVQKLIDSYGHRSAAAAEAEVDRKSLMHAVRVYEQSLELLRTGKITFPRKNAQYLLDVKTGLALDEVKSHLVVLEQALAEEEAKCTRLPSKTPELEAAFDGWLLSQLRQLYQL